MTFESCADFWIEGSIQLLASLQEELLKTLADINFCKELLGNIAWALSHPLCGRSEEETLVPLAFDFRTT